MKRSSNDRLLREYVRTILREDEGYGDMMGASYDMSPYGAHFASGNDLYKTFIKPFTDVVDVAAGKTKEMSAKVQTSIRVAFEAIGTVLLPWTESEYQKIFDHEKDQLDKIRSEYADVYGATWDALTQHDAVVAAFLMAPGAVLTGAIAKKTPEVTMKVLSVLSGGALDPFLNRVKKSFGSSFGKSSGSNKFSSPGGDGIGGGGGMGGGSYFESVIREENDAKQAKKKPSLADVLTNKKVVIKAVQSPKAQRIKKEVTGIVQGTLRQVYEKAETLARAKSLDDLQKAYGKPLKGLDKIKQVPQQERQAAEQQLLATLKKSVKEFYAKSLEAQVKIVLDAGIPENSEYVKDYKSVVQKIRAL